MMAFIGLALGTGELGEPIQKVMIADLIGSLGLVAVIFLRWMNTRGIG